MCYFLSQCSPNLTEVESMKHKILFSLRGNKSYYLLSTYYVSDTVAKRFIYIYSFNF